jgi:hypothetical protein
MLNIFLVFTCRTTGMTRYVTLLVTESVPKADLVSTTTVGVDLFSCVISQTTQRPTRPTTHPAVVSDCLTSVLSIIGPRSFALVVAPRIFPRISKTRIAPLAYI